MGNVGFICSPDGAKSSYEIGCIKAIKELNGNISFSAGNFMGSINAALIALDDMDSMIRFHRSASKADIDGIVRKVAEKYTEEWAQCDHAAFMLRYLTYVTSDDKDISRLRKLIAKFIDEEKLRSSVVKFAFVGLSPYTFMPEVYTMEKIPRGQLHDYLLCSALYPVISLAGKEYKIGIPYEFSSYRAAENFSPTLIISTDETSERRDGRLPLKIISPSEMINITSNESAEDMIRNIRLGYIDTLREVSFSYGSIYYINRLTNGADLLKDRVYSCNDAHKKALVCSILRLGEYTYDSVTDRLTAMAAGAGMKGNDVYLALLENAANILGVEKSEKYTDESLKNALGELIEKLLNEVSENLSDEKYVLRLISDTEAGFIQPLRVAEYFLVLYALNPDSYPLVKNFVGSLHLKVILAIVTIIYMI